MPDPTDSSAGAGLPPLLYLDAATVRSCLPPLDERLELAGRILRAIDAGAELPPKLGVHPRPADALAHAMPALLPGADPSGADDLLGVKWIAGVPGNARRPEPLPTYHALVVLNDGETGVPLAILDGGPITAARTAAVSGVAIRAFAPPVAGRPPRCALIGAGVQGHAHVPVIAATLAGAELALHSRSRGHAEELAAEARATPGIGRVTVAGTAREAVDGADVVVTAASFGPVNQVLTNGWLTPWALVVAVDYATYAAAEVARDADLFLVDERRQFLATRDSGAFEAYPDPDATIGEVLRTGLRRPSGRVLVTHLGVGLADVVFGAAVVGRARAQGLGLPLPR